jgi:predicted ATP-grasp superfamily ATP-dependent carboligase
MKIFIIHAKRTAYGVIRSLYKNNCDFYIADTETTPLFSSRFVKNSFLINDITSRDNDTYLREILDLALLMECEKEKALVFTGKDDYLLFFCKNWGVLSKYFILSFETDYEILKKALSKDYLPNIAENSKVLIPKTMINKDVNEINKTCKYPLIIKPSIKNSPEVDVVREAFRVKICRTESDLLQGVLLLKKLKVDYVVQEFIPGEDSELYTIATYSFKGELKAWSTSKKIRQFPPNMGECSFGTTLYEERLLEPAKRILKYLKLTGISQIEFKKYKGEFYLIEINPRIWSWHQIHSKVGVNLCQICVNQLLFPAKVSMGLIYPYKGNKGERKWMFLLLDYLHNYKLNKNIDFLSLIRDFIRCDIEAFFWMKDLKVFNQYFKETKEYFKKFKSIH